MEQARCGKIVGGWSRDGRVGKAGGIGGLDCAEATLSNWASRCRDWSSFAFLIRPATEGRRSHTNGTIVEAGYRPDFARREHGGDNFADIIQAKVAIVIAEADEQLGVGRCGWHSELQVGPIVGGQIDPIIKRVAIPPNREFVGRDVELDCSNPERQRTLLLRPGTVESCWDKGLSSPKAFDGPYSTLHESRSERQRHPRQKYRRQRRWQRHCRTGSNR